MANVMPICKKNWKYDPGYYKAASVSLTSGLGKAMKEVMKPITWHMQDNPANMDLQKAGPS